MHKLAALYNWSMNASVITRAAEQYDAAVAHSLIRDLDGVIEKLNTTYQEEIKQEIEAFNFFVN